MTCRLVCAVAVLIALANSAVAQVRVTPKAARGGEKFGEPWVAVPEAFRKVPIPNWDVPTDLNFWEKTERQQARITLLRDLGEMPARPDPKLVKVTSTEDHDGYRLERFEFFNGVDSKVTGMILIPKDLKKPAPTVMGLHGHGGSKEIICVNENDQQVIGPLLVKRGYVVAAIDSYFCGERLGKGPAGKLDATARSEEESLFKLNLWLGRTLWGMMLRDEQCLIDYLETRPEVDKHRIVATGMSMGCTRSWWLAAIDERIKGTVGIACFTRYTELIAHGNLRRHGIYYFVPSVARHFDTEVIYALVAPRPMLQLSGDQDGGAPADGIEILEKKLSSVYRLYNKPENFRSVLYKETGHEYLPEMKEELVAWLTKHFPP